VESLNLPLDSFANDLCEKLGRMTSEQERTVGGVDDVLDLNPTSFVDDVYNAVRACMAVGCGGTEWSSGHCRAWCLSRLTTASRCAVGRTALCSRV
jgi:hypothetical protein